MHRNLQMQNYIAIKGKESEQCYTKLDRVDSMLRQIKIVVFLDKEIMLKKLFVCQEMAPFLYI